MYIPLSYFTKKSINFIQRIKSKKKEKEKTETFILDSE